MANCLFVAFSDYDREKEKWMNDLNDMRETLRTSENQLTQVSSQLEESERRLSSAMQIRRDADRDVLQSIQTIQELQGQLKTVTSHFDDVWEVLRQLIEYIGHPGDAGINLLEYMPLIPSHIINFMKDNAHDIGGHVHSRVRVLSPDAPLDRIVDFDQDFLAQVEAAQAQPELKQIVDAVAVALDLQEEENPANPLAP